MEIRKIIISRGRSKVITSHKFFTDFTLCVPESEVDSYSWIKCDIIPYPDKIEGLGKLRNWVLNNFKEKAIIMIDDDIIGLHKNFGKTGYRIKNKHVINEILISTAICAADLKVNVFGFSQFWDTRKYNTSNPFNLNGWVGGVIGIIGRKYKFIDNYFKVDIDFCLQNLLRTRIIWIDNRYGFYQKRDMNLGGNSIYRTMGRIESEKEKLKMRWGKYIEFKDTKSTNVCKIKVKRKKFIKNV